MLLFCYIPSLLLLRDPSSPRRLINDDIFKDCHSHVNPNQYYQNCLFDACGCDMGGDCMCYCEAIETYAKQCNNKGITIGWRIKTEECRKFAMSPWKQSYPSLIVNHGNKVTLPLVTMVTKLPFLNW